MIDESRLDALLPPEMAAKAETVGVRKARTDPLTMFALSILAGAFIALGALFSTTVIAGASGSLPFGITRLVAGLVFSLGLVLVIVGGAELFTGNTLVIMAWASGKVRLGDMVRGWALVYAGNFIGGVATAALVFESGQYAFGGGAVGASALATANAKVQLELGSAIALGVLCNALVCLAMWLTFSARSTTDRILAIVPPISAFVAAGFEHSVANMYFIPIALFIRAWAPESFWNSIDQTPAAYPALTWERFLAANLLPVTVGNLIGGAVLVGAVYWFIYLRGSLRTGGAEGPVTRVAEMAAKPTAETNARGQ